MVAAIIEFGHWPITPKNKEWLKFQVGRGKTAHWVMTKLVSAVPPRPYLYPAFQDGVNALIKYCKEEFSFRDFVYRKTGH